MYCFFQETSGNSQSNSTRETGAKNDNWDSGAAIAASILAGAAYAGGSLPLAVVFALIACLLSASSIGLLAREMPAAGVGWGGWVSALCGLDPLDAYQLVTQAVESPLANVCDTNYTSIAKMPKRYLPTAAFGGIHDQLRELATSL